MRKYFIDLYIPAVETHLDIVLPSDKKIGEAIPLLGLIARAASHDIYLPSACSMLLYADTGEPVNLQSSVEEAGIRNSSRLILI